MNAIAIVENAMLSKNVKFVLVRVPFFLEPGYINKPPDFWESHDERMLRKFGSMQAFERFKAQHGLIPRGREVGLDDSVGYNDENLSRRRQSSTLNAHRLVYYIAKEYSLEASEKVYDELNRKHFTESGILNDKMLLLDAAESVLGSDERQKCSEFLGSYRGVEAVMRTVDAVHELGIHSIPTLVIDGGRVVMSGAERAESIAETLLDIMSDSTPSGRRLFQETMLFD